MTVTALRPAPRVYMAGKIAKYLHWRSAALGDLLFLDPNREWSDWGRGIYETQKALDPDFFMTAHDRSRPLASVGPPLFTLVGPFFVGLRPWLFARSRYACGHVMQRGDGA
jgi:hypothetical protein